jgi:hypothetical protein
MTWLAAQFCVVGRGSRRIPSLLRLDDPKDQRVLLEERQLGKRANALVNRLLQRVRDANETDSSLPDDKPDRYPALIRRLQTEGRITLLIDGLDHALSNDEIATDLHEMLASRQWRDCPVWIAGRPEAFQACWDKVFDDPQWEFLRVDPLAEADIRFYLSREAGGDWFDLVPSESRWLLGIPRMLGLISGILRSDIERSTHDKIDAAESVRRLKLQTAADVYYRAYFEMGVYGDLDSQGLLVQGLLKDTEAAWIGLPKLDRADPNYEEPSEENLEDRLQRTSVLLGAIAFEMFGMHADAEHPEPNTAGVNLSGCSGARNGRSIQA